jgi:hypothetical protein
MSLNRSIPLQAHRTLANSSVATTGNKIFTVSPPGSFPRRECYRRPFGGWDFFCIKWRSGMCDKWSSYLHYEIYSQFTCDDGAGSVEWRRASPPFSFVSLTAVENPPSGSGPARGPFFIWSIRTKPERLSSTTGFLVASGLGFSFATQNVSNE